jgi:hypothetical protein
MLYPQSTARPYPVSTFSEISPPVLRIYQGSDVHRDTRLIAVYPGSFSSSFKLCAIPPGYNGACGEFSVGHGPSLRPIYWLHGAEPLLVQRYLASPPFLINQTSSNYQYIAVF